MTEHEKTKHSKDSIRNALLELLKQKSIEAITISELTRLAKVNRSTFYSHYMDKLELLEDLENYFIIEVNKNFEETFDSQSIENSVINAIQKLVWFALEQNNFIFLQLMLSSNGDPKFANKITESIINQINRALTNENAVSIYIKRFVSRGILELIIVWLNDNNRPNAEEFIKLVKTSQLLSPIQLILHPDQKL